MLKMMEAYMLLYNYSVEKLLSCKYRKMGYLHEVQIFANFVRKFLSHENLC